MCVQRETSSLPYYRRALKKRPALLAAADRVAEASPTLGEDERLYLYTMAPAVLEFAEWALDLAQKRGKTRLYFLARDAWPVCLAARRLCAARGIAVDCRYLRVSRYALRMAEYRLLGADCVERLCVAGIHVTFRSVLARAGIESLAERIAGEIGLAGEEDRPLCYAEVQALKPLLRENETFLRAVRSESERAYPGVLAYLRQEGLLEGEPFALVDSGWIGTLQETLTRLLRSECPDVRPEGYYFGLYEIPKGAEANTYFGFYFTPDRGLRRKVRFSNCLFETLCSAPHGMTLSYDKTPEGVRPVMPADCLNKAPIERWCALVDRLAETYAPQPDGERVAPACAGPLCRLMGSPRRREAELFGPLLFCDNLLETSAQPVAAPLTAEEIRAQRIVPKLLRMLGRGAGETRESAWIEGSIVLRGECVQSNLLHARLYKTLIYIRKWLNAKR